MHTAIPFRHWSPAALASLSLSTLLCLVGCTNSFSTSAGKQTSASTYASDCAQASTAALQDPATIDDAMKLINDLPKPLTIDCFLANLKKPLKVFAVNNSFSAQPSAGARSPRILIINKNLVISVVPEGFGAKLVEFSEITGPNTSVKGEIEFPILAQAPASAPYDKILEPMASGTSCRFCHQNETRATNITTGEAYASNILRPDPFQRVKQETAKSYSIKCNMELEPYRCRMLKAVFIEGEAQDAEFPTAPVLD